MEIHILSACPLVSFLSYSLESARLLNLIASAYFMTVFLVLSTES